MSYNDYGTGMQLFDDDFYEKFPHLKPAEEPQFTQYDAFGIAANTDFEPFDSIFNNDFFD